jgi:transposase
MSETNQLASKGAPKRKKASYSPQFKLDRALEAISTNNVAEIARKYNLSPNVIYLWRDQVIERGTSIFNGSNNNETKELKAKVSKLEQMIGKKEVELSLLKNFSDFYSSRNQA